MDNILTYHTRTNVFLNGEHVGAIEHNKSGTFQYFPKDTDDGGDLYPTLAACKASLEAE